MASQVEQTAKPKPAASLRQSTQLKQYVNQQLERTRTQVKITELIGGLLTILAFAICFLLVAAIWDAWIWPLSTTGRWICLLMLLGISAAYACTSILPLFLKRINTEYAAKMIEEAKPSFKNSLLNYVSLRKTNQLIRPAVLDAVSRQAATDLASVPSDATVDRSKLIRLGFILIGLVVVGIVYQILSPKDAFQTIGRVLAPNAKIAKPAVVKISDVTPGDSTVFFGEQVEITAVIQGRFQPDDVKIEYSTKDGQLIDQVVPMVAEETGNRYQAMLPGFGNGIQQSLTYRVVAQDGASPYFDITVQPNPTIAVESLVLMPPSYTNLPERVLTGTGNIDVLEGTNVTINAVANLPIKVAYIELLDETVNASEGRKEASRDSSSRYNKIRTIEMRSEGKTATARVMAQLNASRKKPFASHYQIWFVSDEDDRNQKPNIYPIRITPDLAPEVVITNPDESDVSVPENGTLSVEIEANDLDFAISSVEFHLDFQGGTRRLDKQLQLKSGNGNQRVTARYILRPSELGLENGDEAMFFATASDNRTSPQSGQPDPNVSRTENFTLTISEPEERADQQDKGSEQTNPQEQEEQQEQSDESQSGAEPGDGEDSETGEESSDSTDPNAEQEGGEGSQSEDGESQGADSENTNPGNQTGDQNAKKGQQGTEANDQQQENENSESSKDGQAGEGSDNEKQQSEQDPAGAGSKESPDESESNASQDAQSTGDSGQSNNQQGPEANNGPSNSADDMNHQGSEGDSQGQRDQQLSDGQREPLSENAPEGEQFKRLQELLEEMEEQPQTDESSSNSEGQSQSGSSSSGQSEESQNSDEPNAEGQQPDENSGQDKANSNSESANRDSKQDKSNESGNSRDAQSDSDNAQQPPKGPPKGDSQSGQPNPNSENAEQANTKPESDDSASGSDNPTQDQSEMNSESEGGDQKSGDQTSQDQGNSNGTKQQAQSENDSGQTGDESSEQQDQGTSQDSGQTSESANSQSETEKDQSSSESQTPQESSQSSGSQEESAQNDSSQSSDPSSSGDDSGSAQPQTKSQPSTAQDQSGSEGQPGQASDNGSPQTGQQSNESQSTSAPSGAGGGGGKLPTEALEQEKTNLQHSKKATDMILGQLDDQKYEPNPKLLEEMNWTKEDLNQFLARWKEMKRQAEMGNPKAKAKYEKALKSLGLRPNAQRRTVGQIDEEVQGLSEDSAVIQPPPNLAPDFNATLRDLNRARND